MALRRRGQVVGRVQHVRPRDRVLPPVRRGGTAGARCGVRDRPPADPLPRSRPRRRRVRHLAGHDRAVSRTNRARGPGADASRSADARTRDASEVPNDLRVRRHRGEWGPGTDRAGTRSDVRAFEPGGTLVLDVEVPYSEGWGWDYWIKERRGALPEPWPAVGDRRVGADDSEYELRSRIVAVDPLAQQITHEMRGFIWRDGRLVEQDEHVLKRTDFFPNELRLMLRLAGFSDVELRGDYTASEPNADTTFVVFVARKPGGERRDAGFRHCARSARMLRSAARHETWPDGEEVTGDDCSAGGRRVALRFGPAPLFLITRFLPARDGVSHRLPRRTQPCHSSNAT